MSLFLWQPSCFTNLSNHRCSTYMLAEFSVFVVQCICMLSGMFKFMLYFNYIPSILIHSVIWMHGCTYVLHTHAHACTNMHEHARMNTHAGTHTHEHTHAHMHTRTHAHTHTRTHAHTHTRTHAHTHTHLNMIQITLCNNNYLLIHNSIFLCHKIHSCDQHQGTIQN